MEGAKDKEVPTESKVSTKGEQLEIPFEEIPIVSPKSKKSVSIFRKLQDKGTELLRKIEKGGEIPKLQNASMRIEKLMEDEYARSLEPAKEAELPKSIDSEKGERSFKFDK
jgi:hypothetical protein